MMKDDRRTSLTILKLPNGIVTADMELNSALKSLMESALQIVIEVSPRLCILMKH